MIKSINFKEKKALFVFLEKKINNKILLIAGGRIIKQFIKYLSSNSVLISKKLILTDERLVNLNSNFRNDKIIKKLLIKKKLLNKKNFINYKKHNYDFKYLRKFNDNVKNIIPDLAILSLGSEGHIAGIFNLKEKHFKNEKMFNFYHSDNKKPKNRISCSDKYIKKSKKLFLIVRKEKNDLKIFEKKYANLILKNNIFYLFI